MMLLDRQAEAEAELYWRAVAAVALADFPVCGQVAAEAANLRARGLTWRHAVRALREHAGEHGRADRREIPAGDLRRTARAVLACSAPQTWRDAGEALRGTPAQRRFYAGVAAHMTTLLTGDGAA